MLCVFELEHEEQPLLGLLKVIGIQMIFKHMKVKCPQFFLNLSKKEEE